jgi:hypothetical protein
MYPKTYFKNWKCHSSFLKSRGDTQLPVTTVFFLSRLCIRQTHIHVINLTVVFLDRVSQRNSFGFKNTTQGLYHDKRLRTGQDTQKGAFIRHSARDSSVSNGGSMTGILFLVVTKLHEVAKM